MPIYASLGTARTVLPTFDWPVDFFSTEHVPGLLDQIHVLDYTTRNSRTHSTIRLSLAVEGEASVRVPRRVPKQRPHDFR